MPSLKRKILGKPKIVHKGLAMVFLPLALNTTLVGLLDDSLNRTTRWMEQGRQYGMLITGLADSIFLTTSLLINGGKASMGYAAPLLKQQIRADLVHMHSRINTISQHAPGGLFFSSRQSKLSEQIAEQEKMLDEMGEEMGEAMGKETAQDALLSTQLAKSKKWLSLTGNESQILQESLSRCEQLLLESRKLQLDFQRRIEIILIAGLSVNLIMALALIYFFKRDICERIDILVRNSRKIPQNEPIRENVRGYDELADLGKALRAAASQIRETAEYKKTLMQMMAHDLKSPLATAMIAIAPYADSDAQGLSTQDRSDFALISSNLSISLMADLLLLEKYTAGPATPDKQLENTRELTDKAISSVHSLPGNSAAIENKVANIYLEVDRNEIIDVIVRLIEWVRQRSSGGGPIIVSTSTNVQRMRLQISGPEAAMDDVESLSLVETHFMNQVHDNNTGLLMDEISSKKAGLIRDEISGKKAGLLRDATGDNNAGLRLSLAVCRQIIAAHGGTIGIEPAACTIWLELPAMAANAPDEQPEE